MYPRINGINISAYNPMDFSKQWIYFHGDSTLRQVYGEFYSVVHKTQVCCPLHARGTGFNQGRHQVGTSQRNRVHAPRDWPRLVPSFG